MEKLKQIIESTLIGNLKFKVYDLDDIQTCSDKVAKEIKDIAIEFANWKFTLVFENRVRQGVDGRMYMLSEEELFNQFIKDKYKES